VEFWAGATGGALRGTGAFLATRGPITGVGASPRASRDRLPRRLKLYQIPNGLTRDTPTDADFERLLRRPMAQMPVATPIKATAPRTPPIITELLECLDRGVVPDSVGVGNGAGSVEESESFRRLIALTRASSAFI
jgi:hypothetical protein